MDISSRWLVCLYTYFLEVHQVDIKLPMIFIIIILIIPPRAVVALYFSFFNILCSLTLTLHMPKGMGFLVRQPLRRLRRIGVLHDFPKRKFPCAPRYLCIYVFVYMNACYLYSSEVFKSPQIDTHSLNSLRVGCL